MKTNPGPGSWSFVAYNGRTRLFGSYQKFTKEPSNRAKMMAITGTIKALRLMDETPRDFTFHTNYKTLVDAIDNGWVNKWRSTGWKNSSGKSVDNQDLWEELDGYVAAGELDVVWSKKQAFRYKLPRKATRDINRRCFPNQTEPEQQ